MPERSEMDRSLAAPDISDDDIYDAMKEIPGYLDITIGDAKEIYRHAYRHAFQRIESAVKARDLMTRRVHHVQKETPLREVAEIMACNNISGVPVIDENNRVVGVISEKDFISHMGGKEPRNVMRVIAECLQNKGCLAVTIRGQQAKDIMSSPAITIQEDTVLKEINIAMTEKKINRVPVVDGKGRLKGIVSRADIVRTAIC